MSTSAGSTAAATAPSRVLRRDVGFWAERLREAKYAYTEEELRPYFPLPQVLNGLFALIERLFGVRVEAADGAAPVWHADVRFFAIKDKAGAPVAYFYLDPYSRPAEKRGGAWMDEVVGRSRALAPAGAAVRLPVAHMVCNGTPPVGDKPSLMTFREARAAATYPPPHIHCCAISRDECARRGRLRRCSTRRGMRCSTC